MAKRTASSRRTTPGSGRVTPKGTRPDDAAPRPRGPEASTRYTPPVPQEMKVSPRWVPFAVFGLLGLGFLVIILNYFSLLPGGTDNWYLFAGLGLITGGFIFATRWH